MELSGGSVHGAAVGQAKRSGATIGCCSRRKTLPARFSSVSSTG
jgi:hypothetical protein